MFSTAIQEATLLSQELEAFAPNLHADDYQQDRSFLATARALLPERVPEGESFIIRRNEVFTEDMERKVAYAQSTEHPFLVISDVVMPRDDVRSYFSLLEEGKILPAEYHPLVGRCRVSPPERGQCKDFYRRGTEAHHCLCRRAQLAPVAPASVLAPPSGSLVFSGKNL